MDLYELKGTERVEKETKEVSCGQLTATSYFDEKSGDLVRRDVNLVIDEGAMVGMKLGG